MPACTVLPLGAGGDETVKPPTTIVAGAPPTAPFQLGALEDPVPGQVWQLAQSVDPDAPVSAEWL